MQNLRVFTFLHFFVVNAATAMVRCSHLSITDSSVATGGMRGHVPAGQPQSGRVMGIAEIRGEKIEVGRGIPDHLGQTNYAEIFIYLL